MQGVRLFWSRLVMPVKINNLESDIHLTGGGGSVSEADIEMIVQVVMDRFMEEKDRAQRIDDETRITNAVSKKDLFD